MLNLVVDKETARLLKVNPALAAASVELSKTNSNFRLY
jgi:hypothetical protein